MKKLLIATTNRGKQKEFRALLAKAKAELVFPQDIGLQLDVEENGATYRENAGKKALAFAQAAKMVALADDSGLEVEVLGGEPGIRSSRYAGADANDQSRRDFLLQKLQMVPLPRKARFVCVLAVATPEGSVLFAEGDCPGEITLAERGSAGFGYDPIFQPAGREITMAEISPEEKNRISHRARAVQAALPMLKKILAEVP
jgi:XTP/dITP diphosphohydrolase